MTESHPTRFLVFLTVLTLFAAFFELGRMDVVSDNEGQRATPPAEMLRSGNFVIPTINGAAYLAKPPLLYWAIAGVYNLTGTITPFTARIPTALSGVALVLCAYLLLRKDAGEMPARWTAFTLLASPYVLDRVRWAELDVPLTLATFLAILAMRRACMAANLRAHILSALGAGLALGAAILLKGPVPLLFVASAWVAYLIVEGNHPGAALRLGIWGSVTALLLALLLALLQMILPISIPFPVALAVFCAVWTFSAWRYAGTSRTRCLSTLLLVVVTGIAVAAPWAVAVVQRVGLDYLQGLLHEQVAERTYQASRINSGSPFYFLIALPVMLAPWGLLLPLHATRGDWRQQPPFYRFALVTGWISVGVFSMIAGKEYEYILPAVPFLLAVTGFHLSMMNDALQQRWVTLWLRVLPILFPLAGTAAAIVISLKQPQPLLWINVWILALAMLLALLYRRKEPRLLLSKIAFMALTSTMIWQLDRNFSNTGAKSPQAIARACRTLIAEGYTVEATKVYPGFSFYAATGVSLEQNPDAIKKKLAGEAPYYYLTREELVKPLTASAQAPPFHVLTKPYTNKRLLLIGNRPLPDLPALRVIRPDAKSPK